MQLVRAKAREKAQPVSSEGERATGVKRAKTCNRCQAREKMQPVSRAGKRATSYEGGRTLQGVKKRATSPKGGKTRITKSRFIFVLSLIG